MKRDEIAWIGTHRHDPNGNEPYVSSYVFMYGFDLPAGTKEIHLPSGLTAPHARGHRDGEAPRVTPAGALYVADIPEPKAVSSAAPAKKH